MAKTTFAGPVRSLGGFINAGSAGVVSLTADTSLTVASHAGRLLLTNDADGKFTLPSIDVTTPTDATDPNQLNNLGATFTFLVITAATDMDILTDQILCPLPCQNIKFSFGSTFELKIEKIEEIDRNTSNTVLPG